MEHTPEAWDADFEEFRAAVGQAVAEDTLVICGNCDWIGSIEDVQESECPKCGHPIYFEDGNDVPLDGDFDSTMESIGWGYDEQYEHGGDY